MFGCGNKICLGGGLLGKRVVALVDCWCCKLLVLWNVGVVDCWCCGMLVLWNGNSGKKRMAALHNKGVGCGLLGYAGVTFKSRISQVNQ